MVIIRNFLILLGVLSTLNPIAQEYKNYSTKNGLPSNHVYDVTQDNEGFMWFSTNRGLAKFDGENFKVFTMKDGLPNNDIWLIDTDSKGRVWFFSKSKYQGYIENDSVHSFITEGSVLISPTFISRKDSLIKMNNYTLQDGMLVNNKEWMEFGNEVNDSYQGNELLLGVDAELKKIFTYSKNSLNILNEYYEPEDRVVIAGNCPDTITLNLFTHHGKIKEDLYFFPLETGIIIFDKKRNKAKYHSFLVITGIEKADKIFYHFQNESIQASVNNHILVFEDSELVGHKSIDQDALNEVLFMDRDENIWILSPNEGVTFISNIQYNSTYQFRNKRTTKIENFKDQLYVGINGDGVYYQSLFSKDGEFKKLDFDFLSNEKISKIRHDSVSDEIFIITTKKNRILDSTGGVREKIITNSLNEFILGFKDLQRIDNRLYGVTHSAVIYQNQIGDMIHLSFPGLFYVTPYQGEIYLGGMDGAFVLKDASIQRPIRLDLDYPISFMTVQDDLLWIGTGGKGVFVFDGSNLTQLDCTEGMIIQRIIHQNENLWIATENGIRKIQLDAQDYSQSKMINSFFEADGLLQKNTNDFYLEDSILYVTSDIGLARINTKSQFFKKKPVFYIEKRDAPLVYTYGKSLNHSFEFDIVDFKNQSQFVTEYRILPSTQWLRTDFRKVNLGSLDPGQYEVLVRVKDQHNNQSIKSKIIEITPLWRQTGIAKVVFVLIFLFFLLLMLRLYSNRIRKNEQKKAKQHQRLASLELKSLRSQMNPHFVHNSLNAIQYYIQRNEVELSENYLSKFSRLIRLFFEYSRQHNITLKQEIDLLTQYLTIEQLRFEEKISFKINVDDKIDVNEFMIPSMILQPIVENSVNHGLFNKPENGMVTIDFHYVNEDSFEVVIEDDGIGVNQALTLKKNATNQVSNSSIVLKERLELLNQSKNWNINYEIHDRSDRNPLETGTRVVLLFSQATPR